MRLARVVSAFDCCNPSIDRLVETADLDVLQLDYQWLTNDSADRRTGCGHKGENWLWRSYAPGFLKQLRTLHKSLYLDPNLHVVTNAGGRDTLGCVEALAKFLCEHDGAELPITAIRGDNVFAHLEELMAEGIELRDVATGTALQKLALPLVAAQVELGAGPFKTALEEGSRLVVAGCYDGAAPVIAAATSATPLAWDHTDTLAQLAGAARCQQTIVEFDEEMHLELYPQPGSQVRLDQMESQITESTSPEGTVKHADVHYEESHCEFAGVSEGNHSSQQIMGQPPTGQWLLRVTYVAEHFAETVWEIDNSTKTKPTSLMCSRLKSQLGYGEEDPSLEIHFMEPIYAEIPSIIRARFRSPERKRCEEFVDVVKNYVARAEQPRGTWVGTLPTVRSQLAQFCCEVPREAITVSVDTRPAKEWR